MDESNELLKLENQLCFPFYAVSRLITRYYQPLLEELKLTYPQYLVLLFLWEQETATIKEISEALLLNTNTLTPLLKRLEKQGLIIRQREKSDERKVGVSLTAPGKNLREKALQIPLTLIDNMNYPVEKLMELKESVDQFLLALRKG